MVTICPNIKRLPSVFDGCPTVFISPVHKEPLCRPLQTGSPFPAVEEAWGNRFLVRTGGSNPTSNGHSRPICRTGNDNFFRPFNHVRWIQEALLSIRWSYPKESSFPSHILGKIWKMDLYFRISVKFWAPTFRPFGIVKNNETIIWLCMDTSMALYHVLHVKRKLNLN